MFNFGGEMLYFRGARNQVITFFALLFVSFSVNSKALNNVNSYYGSEFYKQMSSNLLKDDQLKNTLFEILTSVHTKDSGSSNEPGFDQISDKCLRGGQCYSHVSVGYTQARTILMGDLYLVQDSSGKYSVKEVYCNWTLGENSFSSQKPAPHVIPDNKVVNAEHTWPQSHFTSRFSKDTQKADLHHLFPTDSQMNSFRSSYPFGEVDKDKQVLKCRDSRLGEVNGARGTFFEPPQNHKGNVARALFYFSVRYQMPIGHIEEKFLRQWHEQDPVDDSEIKRNNEIFKNQGNRNPFVDHPELEQEIADF